MMPSAQADAGRAVFKHLADCPAYRISEHDTNYFALLFDGEGEGCDFVAVVEVFEPGGTTPPNAHRHAHEMFFVLEGTGAVTIDAAPEREIAKGDALLVRPGAVHVVRNTGASKLYCLTVMSPDDAFAALIRRGTRVHLAPEDLAVLRGHGH